MAWTRNFWETIRPYSTGRVYVNSLGEDGQDPVRAAYGDAKYERLRALKRTYDPTNLFLSTRTSGRRADCERGRGGRRSGEPIPG
jgi:Berberine and berberine like